MRGDGCTPAWMQAVKRRWEQAADAYRDVGGRAASGTGGRGGSNSPPLEGYPPGRGGRTASGTSGQGIQEGGPGVRRIARLTLAGITHTWSFPPGGNGLSKPLDSSFRWNDNRGFRLSPGSYGPLQRPVPDLPAAGRHRSTTSAACSRRGSTTYIRVGVGGSFQTRPYHLHPCRRTSP